MRLRPDKLLRVTSILARTRRLGLLPVGNTWEPRSALRCCFHRVADNYGKPDSDTDGSHLGIQWCSSLATVVTHASESPGCQFDGTGVSGLDNDEQQARVSPISTRRRTVALLGPSDPTVAAVLRVHLDCGVFMVVVGGPCQAASDLHRDSHCARVDVEGEASLRQ